MTAEYSCKDLVTGSILVKIQPDGSGGTKYKVDIKGQTVAITPVANWHADELVCQIRTVPASVPEYKHTSYLDNYLQHENASFPLLLIN